jgi:CheY-like chemotaxis protein
MKLNKIMLIDDDKIFNYLHLKILEQIPGDYEITSYQSPVEALESLVGSASADLPDIIFLDINMPELTGFELIEQIKEQKNELLNLLKIVIVTSSLNPNDYETHKQYDVIKMYCNKPLNIESATKILNALLIKD